MSDRPDESREGSRDVPYATRMTGRGGDGFGALVPLLSGFGLLALGLMTLVFGRGDGGDYRSPSPNGEITFLFDASVAVTGLALVVVGVVVIFRALRKYDW